MILALRKGRAIGAVGVLRRAHLAPSRAMLIGSGGGGWVAGGEGGARSRA